MEHPDRPTRFARAVASLDEVSAETEVKYEGYLRRQATEIERSRRQEDLVIPEAFVYNGVPGLSREIVERLSRTREEQIFERVDGRWRFSYRDLTLIDMVGDVSHHLAYPITPTPGD